MPLPASTLTLRFDADQPEALRLMNTWAGQPLPIEATAWWDGALLVRLAGASNAVKMTAAQLGGEAIPEPGASQFWFGLRDQRDEFFASAANAVFANSDGLVRFWRLSVPSTAPELKLHGEQLVEWGARCAGSAHRWPRTKSAKPPPPWVATPRSTLRRTRRPAPLRLPAPLMAIHRRLKASFDPQGVFNPGRLYADL